MSTEEVVSLREKFAKMEEQITNLSSRVDEKFDNFGEKIDALSTLLKSNIESNEARFAGKWVEKLLLWAGGIVGTSLLLYVVNHFINSKI